MSPCQSSPFRRVLRTRYNAVPTTCSCNNVFFNLWGACLLSQTNTSNLPTFGDWASNCTNRSINLTVGSPNNSVHVPSWAFASVSGNSTFNVDEALSVAKKKGWATMQILAPVIVGVGILALASVIFFCRWKGKKRIWSFTAIPLRPRVYKVQKANRDRLWSIDRTGEAEEYMVDDGHKQHSLQQSSKGHTRLSSSDSISDPSFSNPVQPTLPLGSRIAHQLRSLPGQFPLPWRDRAIQVQNKPPRRGFRVDSWDVSVSSGPSDMGHSRRAPTSGVGRSQDHDTILEEDESDIETTLISPVDRSENSVYLISNQPGNFTFESGSSSSNLRSVQVIPPTPDSSYSSALQPIREPPSRSRTPIPPPPTQPAPPPPSSHRAQPQLQRPDAGPVVPRSIPPNVPINRSHSPFIHYDSPEGATRNPAYVQHVPPRVTSPLNSRQLPIAAEAEQTSGLLRRGLVSASSIESLYLTHPTPGHQRSLSDVRLPMGPHLDSSPMSPVFGPRHSSEEELARQDQIPSGSSSRTHQARSSSPFHRALTPTLFSPHRRGTDDSTVTLGSLYSRDSYHHSSESIIPGRGDPVMLFPGSVRGAGYAPQSPQTPPPPLYHDRGF
ncbi:hypothetical protein L208DRAFT_893021 [Tricholoma matsutake]|nr:hypothetical protein L208DRAFT_893021 [Tricholoma matsutake 945]